jgi:hypothetical protein
MQVAAKLLRTAVGQVNRGGWPSFPGDFTLAIFLLIAGGAGVGWGIYQGRLTKTQTSSASARLKTRVDKFFKSKGQPSA